MNAKTVLSLISAGIIATLNPISASEITPNVTQDVTNLYPTCGVVTEVNSTEMTFADFSGNLWTVLDPQDYAEGDRIAAIMDDNGTPIIYDDIVVSTKYCGWVYQGQDMTHLYPICEEGEYMTLKDTLGSYSGWYELHDYKGKELYNLSNKYNDCRVLQIRAIDKDKIDITINPDIKESED